MRRVKLITSRRVTLTQQARAVQTIIGPVAALFISVSIGLALFMFGALVSPIGFVALALFLWMNMGAYSSRNATTNRGYYPDEESARPSFWDSFFAPSLAEVKQTRQIQLTETRIAREMSKEQREREMHERKIAEMENRLARQSLEIDRLRKEMGLDAQPFDPENY